MSGYTPGPWKWWTSNSWRRLRADEGHGRDRSVLEPYTCRDHHADCIVSEADMALIAAAPDLLEALKDTLRIVEAAHRQLGMWTDNNKRLITARAAIAKAEGKPE